MTSQGTAHGRFQRAVEQGNLFAAEIALREMGQPALSVALEYLGLLARVRPEKFQAAAVRWHGRLELEARTSTLAESQLALAALVALGTGDQDALELLRRLLRRARPSHATSRSSTSARAERA
jgi:hypothetical protein